MNIYVYRCNKKNSIVYFYSFIKMYVLWVKDDDTARDIGLIRKCFQVFINLLNIKYHKNKNRHFNGLQFVNR